jgi:hypothetical protein
MLVVVAVELVALLVAMVELVAAAGVESQVFPMVPLAQ